MSLLDVNPGEARELEAVPAGQVDLSIISAEVVPLKNDPQKSQIALVFRVEGVDNALPIRDWIGVPHSSDDSALVNRKLLRLKTFCEAFDYDYSNGIETEELPGLAGKAIVKVEHDEEYGDQNRISRYVV